MNKFWNIRNEGSSATLEIMGSIGDPKTVQDWWTGEEIDIGGSGTLREISNEIKALGSPTLLTVKISSEGGLVSVALAVHNMLTEMKNTRIVAEINGFCWSAATIVAMAADEVRMASNGSMMIHDAEVGFVSGDVAALDSMRAALDSMNRAIAASYTNKAGGTQDEWLARMYETTWLTGEEAKALGLVDVLTDAVEITAKGDAAEFAAKHKAPEAIRAQVDKPNNIETPTPETPEMTAEEINQLVADATAKAIADHKAESERAIQAATAKAEELAAKITAQETELTRIKELQANGVHAAAAAATNDGKPTSKPDKPILDFTNLSAFELIRMGRENKAA